MDDTVFFNLGNAIASDFDTKELERTAQVEYAKGNTKGKLVIVKDPNNPKDEHILFDLSDKEESADHTQPFKVKKVMTKKQLEV